MSGQTNINIDPIIVSSFTSPIVIGGSGDSLWVKHNTILSPKVITDSVSLGTIILRDTELLRVAGETFSDSYRIGRTILYGSGGGAIPSGSIVTERNFTDEWTIHRIANPNEATLSLSRIDGSGEDKELLDLYNFDYSIPEYGIRMYKRGSGNYRNFIISYSDGSTIYKAISVLCNNTGLINDTEILIHNKLSIYTTNYNITTNRLGKMSFTDPDSGTKSLYSLVTGQTSTIGTIPKWNGINILTDGYTVKTTIDGTASNSSFATSLAIVNFVNQQNIPYRWYTGTVLTASTANTDVTSLAVGSVVDGVTLTANDIVLLKDQNTSSQNGLYSINVLGPATRIPEMDSSTECKNTTVFIYNGLVNSGTTWLCTSTVSTLEVDPILFTRINQINVYSGGGGISIAGTIIAIDSTVVTLTGSQILSNKTLTTPIIGSFINANHDHSNNINGGTILFASLGSKPTTLSGYSITDAYTKTEINSFFSGGVSITGYNNSNWDAAYSNNHVAVTLGTANGLSLSTQQLSLQLASTSNTGALSSTDWNSFNSKESPLGNPAFTGYVLSSTTGGIRSWVAAPTPAINSDILYWNSGTTRYTSYTTSQAFLSFDTSSTNPSITTRINLNGNLNPTKLTINEAPSYGYGINISTTNAYSIGIQSIGYSAFNFISTGGASAIRGYLGSVLQLEQISSVNQTTGYILQISRSVSGGNPNLTNDLVSIIDNPLTSGTIGGKVLTVTLGTTERILFHPRVSDISGAIAYKIDTHNRLTYTNSRILSLCNQGTELGYMNPFGEFYVSNTIDVGLISTECTHITTTSIDIETGGFNVTRIHPSVANGATAIAYTFSTFNTLAASGSKLLSVQNNTVETFRITPITTDIGDIIGGNYTSIESDGTLKFNGNATVFKNLYPSSVTVGSGASAASFTVYNGANLFAYEFLGNGVTLKSLQLGFQINHDYKEGSDVVPHIHLYVPDDGSGGVIKFYMNYTWANINATGTISETTISGTLTRTASQGIDNNAILSFGAITGTGKTISSILMCRIYRDPADVTDTFGSSVWLKSTDIHYECDTIGSRTISTK